mmetsp:Transcript_64159/g.202999  ORF Transcript_64159/g.202999 Transcript_64159/m.202999 type:complete len:110 (-) Transcript_64159:499-828(-)
MKDKRGRNRGACSFIDPSGKPCDCLEYEPEPAKKEETSGHLCTYCGHHPPLHALTADNVVGHPVGPAARLSERPEGSSSESASLLGNAPQGKPYLQGVPACFCSLHVTE